MPFHFVLIAFSVRGMTNFHDFLHAISAAALDTLVGFDRQAALDAGVDPSRAKAWAELHDVYFGTTNSPQKQRLAGEKPDATVSRSTSWRCWNAASSPSNTPAPG